MQHATGHRIAVVVTTIAIVQREEKPINKEHVKAFGVVERDFFSLSTKRLKSDQKETF